MTPQPTTRSKGRPKRVDLPYLIRDRDYLRKTDRGEDAILLATPLQTYSAVDDGAFDNGPVCPRVAVLDFDPQTRQLRPGTRFRPQGVGRTVSCYDLGPVELDADSPIDAFEADAFIQVSPFATVLHTLDFFEGSQILGRRLRWSFPSDQLLVVPRAGEMQNAYYDRDSGSLQFFYHRSAEGHTVYTALSHSIVVHETTHAILDAIAPDLYDAITPQSLALHEAVADISAIAQTLTNEMVVFSLDAITGATVDGLEVLSRIAEEFGSDVRFDQGASFLRRMRNHRTLDPADDGVDEFGVPNRPDPTDVYGVSQVLSGAIYSIFEQRMLATKRGGEWDTLEKIYCPAAQRVARIVFRALDYLPPGEASFADYGRAFAAAAATTYAEPQIEQRWLAEEFRRRGIIAGEDDLAPPDDLGVLEPGVELLRLVDDAEAARSFAAKHRELLGIPRGTDFEVLPPAVASRSFGSRREEDRTPELVFKVRWKELEGHRIGEGYGSKWAVTRGTALVVDAKAGAVLSLLTTDAAPSRAEERRALLRRWADEGRLRSDKEALGPDGRPLVDVVVASTHKGVSAVAGSGRTLHLAAEEL